MDEDIYYPDINRAALIVKLKKSFIDWLVYTSREHDGEDCLKAEEIETEGFDSKHVYLIPAFDENEDYGKFLKKNYRGVFAHELSGWYTNPSMWPQDRSWKVFQQWLDCEIQTMVLDMCDDDFEHEE